MASSSSAEAEQDPEPDEPTFKFDQNDTSTHSLLSRGGSGYESQYGSVFGSRFSVTDGSGIFVSSLALTIIVSAIAVVGIVLVTIIITLAVMLSSCPNSSTVTAKTEGLADLCLSYRLNVELNNMQGWETPARCDHDIFNYFHSGQYIKDIEVVVNSARSYLKSLRPEGNLSYAVVLDIDETALSSAFLYQNGNHRTEDFADQIWGLWMNRTKLLPVFPVLDLFQELRAASWIIFFVSERPQSALELTEKNLRDSGYEGWRGLLLRSSNDAALTVQAYKSNRRAEIEKQGYKILSVLGDQWSDLVGPATGDRTFKLPNPMYQIL